MASYIRHCREVIEELLLLPLLAATLAQALLLEIVLAKLYLVIQ
jgi:hypothetical protein